MKRDNRRKKNRRRNNRTIHSEKGAFSLVCGVFSLLFLIAGIVYSVIYRGHADLYAGSIGLVSMIFAFMGLLGGIVGFLEESSEHLFCIIGTSLNLIIFGGIIVLAFVS